MDKKQYFEAFGIKDSDVSLVGFCKDINTVLITLTNGGMIRYSVTRDEFTIVFQCLPSEFMFIGFQHSSEGFVFSSYVITKGK